MTLEYIDAGTSGEPSKVKIVKKGRTVARILHSSFDGMYRIYRGDGGAGTSLMQQPLTENADLDA